MARMVMMGVSCPAQVSRAYATPMPPSSSTQICCITSDSLIAPAGDGRADGMWDAFGKREQERRGRQADTCRRCFGACPASAADGRLQWQAGSDG